MQLVQSLAARFSRRSLQRSVRSCQAPSLCRAARSSKMGSDGSKQLMKGSITRLEERLNALGTRMIALRFPYTRFICQGFTGVHAYLRKDSQTACVDLHYLGVKMGQLVVRSGLRRPQSLASERGYEGSAAAASIRRCCLLIHRAKPCIAD